MDDKTSGTLLSLTSDQGNDKPRSRDQAVAVLFLDVSSWETGHYASRELFESTHNINFLFMNLSTLFA